MKESAKNNIITGTIGAAAAATGVVTGTLINGVTATAAETESDFSAAPLHAAADAAATTGAETFAGETHATHITGHAISHDDYTAGTAQPTAGDALSGLDVPDTEIVQGMEVVAYDRATDDNGHTMDVAIGKFDGHDSQIVDLDTDGRADSMFVDFNDNKEVDNGEIFNVEDQNIAMNQFQDAADWHEEYASNELPDFQNNAEGAEAFA